MTPKHISELDTPAVVVDLDILEKNLESMAAYCSSHGLSLRPHTKTHKIPEIARMQLRKRNNMVTTPGGKKLKDRGNGAAQTIAAVRLDRRNQG